MNIFGPTLNWLLVAALVVGAIMLFVYAKGKSINDEYDRKYQLLGTRGGKAEKKDEKDEEDENKSDDDLMEYEKTEEHHYKNDEDEDSYFIN